MSKDTKMPKGPCHHVGHSEHLCALADQYFHVNCPDEYRAIVENPEYKCQFCGRVANKRTDLCYPAEL